MTLSALFYEIKYGYTLDNKTDANGMEHGTNGQFISKGGNSGERKAKGEKKEEEFKYAKTVPYKDKKKFRDNLSKALENDVKRGFVENDTIGATKLSKHSVGKLGSDKALDKSMRNGFSAREHFDAASRVVKLYETAKLKETKPDDNGDVNILSIKRFEKPFKTCKGTLAKAWITVKESKLHGHRLYSIEVMELEKADIKPAYESGAETNQTDAIGTITHDSSKIKSLDDLFKMIKEA